MPTHTGKESQSGGDIDIYIEGVGGGAPTWDGNTAQCQCGQLQSISLHKEKNHVIYNDNQSIIKVAQQE